MISPLPGITATKPGSATLPLPGRRAPRSSTTTASRSSEEQGLLVLRRPWPGMLRTLYREEERFVETYFSRFGKETYLVGDAARRDEDGYFWVLGRIDDVINVSGHRLSTAEVESAIVSHPKVAEAAVIGQSDEDTGQAICAFVTLEGDLEGGDELVAELARARRRADRQAGAAEAGDLVRRPAEDPLRQDHAPPAARHRRGPRAGRRDDAARPGRDEGAGGEDRRRRRLRRLACALVDHPLDGDRERLQLFLDGAQLAQGDRLGGTLGLQLFLDLGDFGAEEALGEGAGEQGDEADADDQDRRPRRSRRRSSSGRCSSRASSSSSPTSRSRPRRSRCWLCFSKATKRAPPPTTVRTASSIA